jgi:undecaprenyl-diphosphatase
MDFLSAVFLGVLQGLTEFLPVSSSGHLVIAQHFLPGFSQPGVLFDVLLHAGTMAAVVVYFHRECRMLLLCGFRRDAEALLYRRLLLLLVIGTIPAAVIGLTFKDFFVGLFHNLTLVSVMLLVTGLLLYLSERFRDNSRGEGELRPTDAWIAGLAQAGAILPGISRSGSTIAALLFRKVTGETAARFSFLLALPAVLGATVLSLAEMPAMTGAEVPAYAAGTVTSFVTGLLSIHLLMGVVRRRRLFAFALYCWLVGGIFLVVSL